MKPVRSHRIARLGAAWLSLLVVSCGGGDQDWPALRPPVGLAYADIGVIVGKAAPDDVPTSSGGKIVSYAIAPRLPAGLQLNPASGVIDGTPAVAASPQVYTVTGINEAGSVQASLRIEVRDPLLPPAGLRYASPAVVYPLDQAIASNVPGSSGGTIASYAVLPALPEGLALDPATGVIGGTPTTVSASQAYVVTARNDAGTAQATVTIGVDEQVQSPTHLAYSDPSPTWLQYGLVSTDTPTNGGGPIASYSVTPALPEGLALDPATGVISGRPATEVAAAGYVVTGRNSAGSIETTLQIAVVFPTAPPEYTLGVDMLIPVLGDKSETWAINDSVFPYLPNKDGSGYLAFWGDATVLRYAGADLVHLAPAPAADGGLATVTSADGVDSSWENGWAADGRWMLTATRIADGSLVAFVHGENHQFADKVKGHEWNSTGVLTSQDDGLTWIDHGPVVASPKPAIGNNGGLNMTEVVWDAANRRWLGYAGKIPFISTDPQGLPGTWYGYHDDGKAPPGFTQRIDPAAATPPLSSAPGLQDYNVTYGGLTYNRYLKQYILTWMNNGDARNVQAIFSPDGLNWETGSEKVFASEPQGTLVSYPFIVGDTDTLSGQDCYLVYMRQPPAGTPTSSGLRKDMIRRSIHFK